MLWCFSSFVSFDPVKEILKLRFIFSWRKWLFCGKYKWQWKLSFHHSLTISVWIWTEKNVWQWEPWERNWTRSAAGLLHIRIGNLDWCKFGHCKNQARKIDSLCCREVDAMLIAFAKILERKGSISPSSFYGQLSN